MHLYTQEESKKNERIGRALRSKEHRWIFVYESSPLDSWTGWTNLIDCPKNFWTEVEILLIQSLAKFGDRFVYDWRGDHLKLIFLDGTPIIAGKCDNNGTCYAFTTIADISKEIPNDYDVWKISDAELIK